MTKTVTRRILILNGWALALILLLCYSIPVQAGDDIRRDATVRAVERVLPGVVNIFTRNRSQSEDRYERILREYFGYQTRQKPYYSRGSGVIIDDEGFVVTNEHVVRGQNEILVKVGDEVYQAVKVVGDRIVDIALLKIIRNRDQSNQKFPELDFAEDDDLYLGETVLALGNPYGLGASVSKGILSSKKRNEDDTGRQLGISDWLQTDAAINPGNSGGPLINLNGEIIGINVAVYREEGAQGIGFAIPIKAVSEALSELFIPETIDSLWFGAQVKAGSFPPKVQSVEPDSPAALAGILPGDEIIRIDQQVPNGFIEFSKILIQAGDGKRIPLQVRRDQKTKDLTVRLIKLEDFFNAKLIQRRTGLHLIKMTTDSARTYGYPSTEGFLVEEVDAESPAQKADIVPGMVMTGFDKRYPADLIEAAKTVHRKDKGSPLLLEIIVRTRTRGFFGAVYKYPRFQVNLEVR
jgi:S1-C subfamily serine protease